MSPVFPFIKFSYQSPDTSQTVPWWNIIQQELSSTISSEARIVSEELKGRTLGIKRKHSEHAAFDTGGSGINGRTLSKTGRGFQFFRVDAYVCLGIQEWSIYGIDIVMPKCVE